ncbi:UvrD-helicase domain-containing protein [soil metagenome]
MPDPSRPWTPNQLAGITTTGQSLLLSAAAGSGKTAVLAERCVYLVCEAPDPCEIDEILVVAFNEAASLEMKGRIHEALRKRLVQYPSERLEKQLNLAERAAISTLHAFCRRLLRQHFHRVGLDPNFNLLDEDEARLLRYEIARDVFADRYEHDESGVFQSLIDLYGDGDDERLIQQVLKIHALLTSVISPDTWRANSLARLAAAATLRLADSDLGQDFLGLIRADLDLLSSKIAGAIAIIDPLKHFGAYVTKLREWTAVVAHWQQLLLTSGLDTFAAEAASIDEVLAERAKPMKGDLPGKDLAKDTYDQVRKHLKEGFCRQACRFTEAEWQKTVADTLPFAHVLLELVEAFGDSYQAAKSQQRALDFSDLERYALRVLSAEGWPIGEKPSNVARGIQKRFKHVLVDEYQDINEVQDAILRLASRESVASHAVPSNLFCVGDVKQSIYRFRLAEPRRFLERYAAFRSGASAVPGRVIDLQENFRSRAPLLEAINDIFRRLMTKATAEIDYDASQELRPGLKYPAGDARQFTGRPIELHLLPARLAATTGDDGDDADDFEQDEYEAAMVAARIRDLTGHDGSSLPRQVMQRDGAEQVPRDIRLGDIVVLLRSGKVTADRYANILRRWGIPAHADSRTGFFESQEIRDMLALLAVLDNQRQDIPLASVLRGPIGSLSSDRSGLRAPADSEHNSPKRADRALTAEDALATIRLAYDGAKPSIAFHDAVLRYANEKSDSLAATLKDRLAQLAAWRQMIHQRPVTEVLRSIYDDTGLLAYYAGLPGGDQRVANLESLYQRAAQFGTFAKQGLARFLRFLQSLERDSDLGQPSLDPEGNEVVRVMTIHQSKGLEFPVVILPNLGRKFNQLDTAGSILADRRSYLGLHTVDEPRQVRYPSMASMVLRDRIAAQSTAEEIRILYVALTRAREHLILVGSTKPDAMESITPRWAGESGPLPVSTVRGAVSPLDWLLPIAAQSGQTVFTVTEHSAEEIKDIAATPDGHRSSAEGLEVFAQLRPLGKTPAHDATANGVLDRLGFVYPHHVAAATAAARSVTSWTKQGAEATASLEHERKESSPDASPLELPMFLAQDVAPKATDLGNYTHLVLEHYDFAAAAPPLEAQIATLVERALLTVPQAKFVSRESIEWFLKSDLGRRIRDNDKHLRRELPVNFADVAPGVIDPADKVMLRGRLDGFLDLPAGGVVIDYKTDRVEGTSLEARADFYRPQLQVYAKAMSAITYRPVDEAYLVFLYAKKIVAVRS